MWTDRELEVSREEGIDFTRKQAQMYLQPDDLIVAVCKEGEHFAVMIARDRKSDVELFRTGYWIKRFSDALDIIEKTLLLVRKRGDSTGHTLRKDEVLNGDLIDLIMADLRMFGVARTCDLVTTEKVPLRENLTHFVSEEQTFWMNTPVFVS